MPRYFHDLSINAFVQATEDKEKVIVAMENLLDRPIKEVLEEDPVEGMYGNPIIHLTVRIRKEKEMISLVRKWSSMDFWKEALVHMDQRLDDDLIYHIRIDKGEAYHGRIGLWKGGELIGIRIKVATYPASWEKALDIISRIPDL